MSTDNSTPNDGFAAEVDTVVKQFVRDDSGKLALPEGVTASEQALYAAKLEVRRRDTYATLSKTNNDNVALKAENNALAKQWEEDAVIKLTAAETAELAELKVSDVDAYITKRDEYTNKARENFGARKAEVKETAQKESELDRRTRLVTEYNEANPESTLTDDVIANDIPPRITNQLANGDITFDEFLAKAATFLSSGKVIDAGTAAPSDVDLGKTGGTSAPEDRAVEADIRETYNNTVF